MTHAADDDLEDLYEHAPCGYASLRPDGTILRLNATLASWLHVDRQQLMHRRFQDLLTIAGRIYHDTHYMPLLTMQGFAREIAFDLQRPDAAPLPVIVTTIGRRDGEGRLVLYRAAIFDASSRRAYEREIVSQRLAAEQEATARSAVLAMLSHDVRSPLSSVLMATELLAETSHTEERVRYTDVIRRAATSVLELVNAILEHSRLEAGAAVWEAQPTDLRALLGDIVAIHSVAAESKHIELRLRIDREVPQTVIADRYKLGQIVTNLVSNAIRYTEQGYVEVSLRTREVHRDVTELELRVTDTGIGIPEDKFAVIFDEFKQVGPTRRRGASGLGLAISRKLTALAGSTIHVDSKIGEGTTFWAVLRLPSC